MEQLYNCSCTHVIDGTACVSNLASAQLFVPNLAVLRTALHTRAQEDYSAQMQTNVLPK